MVQVLDRVPSGAVPEMTWVEDEIIRQLIIQGRKQTFARAVQNLRTVATARNVLEIREPDTERPSKADITGGVPAPSKTLH